MGRSEVGTRAKKPGKSWNVLFCGGVSLLLGLGFTSVGTPKAFIVLFLSFWYVGLNDGGNTPALDFAGFFCTAGASVRLFYLALASGLMLVKQLVYRARAR